MRATAAVLLIAACALAVTAAELHQTSAFILHCSRTELKDIHLCASEVSLAQIKFACLRHSLKSPFMCPSNFI